MNNSDFISRFVSTSRYGVQHGNLRVTCLYEVVGVRMLADVPKIGTILHSYQTPVAIRLNDGLVFWTERRFSPTTSRHIGEVFARTTYHATLQSGIIPRADIRAISSAALADAIGCDLGFLHTGWSRHADPDRTFWYFNAEYNDAMAETVRVGGVWDRIAAASRPVWQRASAYEYHDGAAQFDAHMPRTGDLRVAIDGDTARVWRSISRRDPDTRAYVREYINDPVVIDASGVTWPRGTRKENRELRRAEAIAEIFGNTLQFPDGTDFYHPE